MARMKRHTRTNYTFADIYRKKSGKRQAKAFSHTRNACRKTILHKRNAELEERKE